MQKLAWSNNLSIKKKIIKKKKKKKKAKQKNKTFNDSEAVNFDYLLFSAFNALPRFFFFVKRKKIVAIFQVKSFLVWISFFRRKVSGASVCI